MPASWEQKQDNCRDNQKASDDGDCDGKSGRSGGENHGKTSENTQRHLADVDGRRTAHLPQRYKCLSRLDQHEDPYGYKPNARCDDEPLGRCGNHGQSQA